MIIRIYFPETDETISFDRPNNDILTVSKLIDDNITYDGRMGQIYAVLPAEEMIFDDSDNRTFVEAKATSEGIDITAGDCDGCSNCGGLITWKEIIELVDRYI